MALVLTGSSFLGVVRWENNLTGTRLQTPDLLVLLLRSCHPSQAQAAGTCHHWLEACSSLAGPGLPGP